MGLGNQAGSSGSENDALIAKWLKTPKEFIQSLKKDRVATCSRMDKMTRTEVRTMLNNAESSKYAFSSEIFHIYYELAESNTEVAKAFSEILATFYKKSNKPINQNDFSGFFSNSIEMMIDIMIKEQHLNLLSEILLRLTVRTDWARFYYRSSLSRLIANDYGISIPKGLKRVLIILLEAYHKIPESSVQEEARDKIRRYLEKDKEFAQYNRPGTWVKPLSRPDSIIFENHYPYLAFMFHDVFSYDKKMDFSALSQFNLSDIKIDKPFTDCINRIIQWEYFDAVLHLLTPATPAQAFAMISNIDASSWEVMREFKDASGGLVSKIAKVMESMSEAEFESLNLSAKHCILNTLIDNTFEMEAIAIYSKHQAYYDTQNNIDITIWISHCAHNQLEQLINEDHEKRIEDTLLPALQYKIKSFILDPASYIALLETHFLLAHCYYQAMTLDQKKSLLSFAQSTQSPLIETLINIYGLGAFGQHGEKFKITWKNQIGWQFLLDNKIISEYIFDRKYFLLTRLSILSDISKRQAHKNLYIIEAKNPESALEPSNIILQNNHRINHDQELKTIYTENVARNMISKMLIELLPNMGEDYITWKDPSNAMSIIHGFVQDDKEGILLKCFSASHPKDVITVLNSYFHHDLHQDVLNEFTTWFHQNFENVINEFPIGTLEAQVVATALISTQKERLNEFIIEVLKKPNNKLVERFVKWLLKNESMLFVIGYINNNLTDILIKTENGKYVAALIHQYKDALQKIRPDIVHAMGLYLIANPLLGNDVAVAKAPPLNYVQYVPANVPQYDPADFPPSFSNDVIATPAPQSESSVMKELEEMKDLLRSIVTAVNKPPREGNAPASTIDAELHAENQRMRDIIHQLCTVVVAKSQEVAKLQTENREIKEKNEMIVKNVMQLSRTKAPNNTSTNLEHKL